MLSVRLNPETEQALDESAAAQGMNKSEILRRLIDERLQQDSHGRSPWQLGCEHFGKHGSGQGQLSITRKMKFKDKLREKTGHH